MWLFLAFLHLGQSEPFITQWSVSAAETITLPLPLSVYYRVSCGGVLITTTICTFQAAGIYNISIMKTNDAPITEFNFNSTSGSASSLVRIISWGSFTMTNTSIGNFANCTNLTDIIAADKPKMLQGAVLTNMFIGCRKLNTTLNWDLSAVVDTSGMFADTNQSGFINFTNTGNVKNMERMFGSVFDQNVSAWNVSSVINCTDFCSYCLLPNFRRCTPCGINSILAAQSSFVCSCSSKWEPCYSAFQTVWRVEKNANITLPFRQKGLSLQVNWGDSDGGVVDDDSVIETVSTDESVWHQYKFSDDRKEVIIKLYGQVSGFRFQNTSCERLLRINYWGVFNVDETSEGMFQGCTSLTTIRQSNADKPIFQPNATMKNMFEGCSSLQNAPMNWDLTNVVSLSGMFKGASIFNSSLMFNSTDSVQDLSEMFSGARSFNGPLVFYSFNNVTSMQKMFMNCTKFNQDICSKLTKFPDKVTDVTSMFDGASSFDQSLCFSNAKIVNMNYMLRSATKFNHSLNFSSSSPTNIAGLLNGASTFNSDVVFNSTENVTSLDYVFAGATAYDRSPPFNDTTSVTSMVQTFAGAISFNREIIFNCRNVTNLQGFLQNARAMNSRVVLTDTTQVVDMSNMFDSASSFNQSLDLNTTNVQNMSRMFDGASAFNQPVPFDTTNVTDLKEMFHDAVNFNQPIQFSTPNVRMIEGMMKGAVMFDSLFSLSSMLNVTSTVGLFFGARSFNQRVELDTSSVIIMGDMFLDCVNFNQSINFTTDKVTSMSHMFGNCVSFNSAIDFSSTANLDTIEQMFDGATSFNQNLSTLRTSKVDNMRMFLHNAASFNQPLGHFNTTLVEDMTEMFANATSFSQALNFSTENVRNMNSMFAGATLFTANISYWNTTNVANCSNFCPVCISPSFQYCIPGEPPFECPSDTFQVEDETCVGQNESQAVGTLPPPPPGQPKYPPMNVTLITSNAFVMVTRGHGYDDSFGQGGTIVARTYPQEDPTVSSLLDVKFFRKDKNYTQQNIYFLAPEQDSEKDFAPLYFVLSLDTAFPESIQICQDNLVTNAYPVCALRDDNGLWNTSSCITFNNVDSATIDCHCDSLGTFAAIFNTGLKRIPSVEFKNISPANIAHAPGGIAAIAIVLFILAIVLLLSIRRDYNERKRGNQKAAKFEHWSQELAKWHWWRCLYPYLIGLQSYHSWFGLVYRKSGTTYRSVDRAVVTAFLLFTIMSITARFRQYDVPVQGPGMGMLAVFPMWALFYLFTHTGKQYGYYEEWQHEHGLNQPAKRCVRFFRFRFAECWRWVWYGVALACVLGMIIYILFASLRFDQNSTYFCKGDELEGWIQDFIIIYLSIACVLEPFVICLYVRVFEDRGKTAFLRDGSPPPAPAPSRVDRVEIEMNEAPLSKYAATSLPVTPIIPFTDVEITGPLGKGAFGRVDQCIWDGADCAIKRLLNQEAEAEFQREVDINRHLYAFKHQFVVNFIGITSHPPGMILELYPLRSVEDYVIRGGALNAPTDLVNILTVLIGGSAGVLHLHKHGVIHRDIAARNFLIKHDLSTAVCDFGLALLLPPDVTVGVRSLEERKSDMLPVNTTAPETLATGEYSAKSDVFMFGIFIWELLARRQPHGDDKDLVSATRDFQSFGNRILQGLRPTISPEWPVPLCNLMLACWAGDPSARPSMYEVNRALRAFRAIAESQKLSLTPPSYLPPAVVAEGDEANYYHHVTLVPQGSIYDTYCANRGFADHYFNVDKTVSSDASVPSAASSSSPSATSARPPSVSSSESIYTSYQPL